MGDEIHFVWLGDEMPELYRENVESFRCMNPQAAVRVHHDSGMLWPRWLDAWRGCSSVAQQSDLLRLSILRREGGWYFDTDCRCLKPLPSIASLELDGKLLAVGNDDVALHSNWGLAAERGVGTVWPMIDAVLVSEWADTVRASSMAMFAYGGEMLMVAGVTTTRNDILYWHLDEASAPRGCVEHPVKTDRKAQWDGNSRPPTTEEE